MEVWMGCDMLKRTLCIGTLMDNVLWEQGVSMPVILIHPTSSYSTLLQYVLCNMWLRDIYVHYSCVKLIPSREGDNHKQPVSHEKARAWGHFLEEALHWLHIFNCILATLQGKTNPNPVTNKLLGCAVKGINDTVHALNLAKINKNAYLLEYLPEPVITNLKLGSS